MTDNNEIFNYTYYITHRQYGVASYHEANNTVSLFEFDGLYVEKIEPDYPEMVCIQKVFSYDTLKLKKKGHYLKHGNVSIGTWEYFDENGQLEHTTNMDINFPVTWEKLEEILKDKSISLYAVDSIFRYYDAEKDEATWSIIINLPMEKGQLYVFDARTGELIEKEIIDMSKEE